MVANLGSEKVVYDTVITVQVTGDPCTITQWEDVDFGVLFYMIGDKI